MATVYSEKQRGYRADEAQTLLAKEARSSQMKLGKVKAT